MESVQTSYQNKFQVPGPTTSVYEHYDEDHEAYRVHVHVEYGMLGTLLMYEGMVHTEFLPMTYKNIPERGILE